MKIICPICDKGTINVLYLPSIRTEKITRGSSINKRSFKRSKEKYQVLNSCQNCGASAKKIEKILNTGKDYKTPSRDKVIERMRRAGLPTRI